MANSENHRQRVDSGRDQSSTNADLFSTICNIYEVEDKKLEQVKTCLSNGADINAVDANNPVLHIAITNNYIKIIKYLLIEGARTDIENSTGKNALALAQALSCNQKILNMLQLCHKGVNTKITNTSDMLDCWNILEINSEIAVLEINSSKLSPDFLHHVEFYDAIDTAGNLFFVDVMLSHMQQIDEDFIMRQLNRLNKQLVIQCGSSFSTQVYCRGHGNTFIINLYGPVDKYEEQELINKLSCGSGFGIGLIIEALKLQLVGKFETEPKSLLNICFDLEKLFSGYKLIDYAIIYGDLLTVRFLSLSLWNLSKLNSWRTTTLRIAGWCRNIDKLGAVLRVKFPIQLDTSISIPDQETAAHFDKCKRQMVETAVNAGHGGVLSFLIRCGVHLDNTIIKLAWEKKRYDSVLVLVKADCVFPYNFELDDIDENDVSYTELRMFVEERDELHSLIVKGDLEIVKKFIKPPSKLYLNKYNDSSVYTALKHNKLDIFMWLKCNLEANFRDESERDSLKNSVRDSASDALLQHFLPTDNAHIHYLIAKSQSLKYITGFKERIQSIYLELNEIPQISKVFKVIQFCDQVDIIYDFARDSIVDIKLSGAESEKGFCEYKAGRIYIGANVDREELLGTIAHELTHLAIQTIYNNDGKPYNVDDGAMKDRFDDIVKDIEKRHYTVNDIIVRVFGYRDQDCWPSEMIVRVNHMLATYGLIDGLGRLKEQVKSLLEFYTNHVEPRFEILVNESHLIKPRNIIKSLNDRSGVICRLEKMKIRFNESKVVKKFLGDEKNRILVVSSKSTWLSLINVYQNLKESSLSENSFLIFQFDDYASGRTEINQALYTPAGKLLVLECPNKLSDLEFQAPMSSLLRLVYQAQHIKIIFIVNTTLLDLLKVHLSTMDPVIIVIVHDDLILNSLTPKSIQDLLTRRVFLQNRPVPLGDLVDTDSYQLVDAEILTKLVNNDRVTIGKQPIVSDGLYNEEYYVKREFDNKIKVKKDILVHNDCNHVFAISESTVEMVYKMIAENEYRVCSFNDFISKEANDTNLRYVVLDSAHAASQFERLRGTFGGRIIHWLEVEVGDFILHKSRCSLGESSFILLNNIEISSEFREHARRYIGRQSEGFCDTANPVFVDGCELVKTIMDEIKGKKVHLDRIVVRTEIFKSGSDIIAVSNTDQATIKKLVSNNIDVECYKESSNANYIILDSEHANEQFNQLCARFPLKNVHWLRREISGLLWRETSAINHNLDAYSHCLRIVRDHSVDSLPRVVEENDFVETINNFKVVLVPNNFGMGKTTVLTRIIKRLNKDHPELWVISAGLTHFNEALNRPDYAINNNDEALDFFVNKLLDSREELKLETTFEKRLLLHLVKNRDDKVIIMLDGLNEITSKVSRSAIITIVNALRQTKVKQLWLTTAPLKDIQIEDRCQWLPYSLKPFSKENLNTFFINYWMNMLGLASLPRLKRYVAALIEHYNQALQHETPLKIKNLAVELSTHCEHFCNSEMDRPDVENDLQDCIETSFNQLKA